MTRLLISTLLGLLAGCAPSGQHPTSAELKAEREAILETDRAFAQRSEDVGAAQAFAEYLAAEALMLPQGAQPVTGTDAIHDYMSAGPEYTLTWEPRDADVSAAGDLGWSWGEYIATLEAEDGSGTVSYGKYVTIWRKQADGSWKAVVDIGNQSPGP